MEGRFRVDPYKNHMGVSNHQGTQDGPQCILALLIGTPKKGPLILGDLHMVVSNSDSVSRLSNAGNPPGPGASTQGLVSLS